MSNAARDFKQQAVQAGREAAKRHRWLIVAFVVASFLVRGYVHHGILFPAILGGIFAA